MKPEQVIQLFEHTGALLNGHFVYASGRHGTQFLQASRVLQYPDHTEALCKAMAERVREHLPAVVWNESARILRHNVSSKEEPPQTNGIFVVTAGTTDLPVAQEAVETLRWMNIEPALIQDVGVAGPHRLIQHVDRFKDAKAIIVVAGMEGALPSVVGGWVSCPVIAVPTSVGYGANLNGMTALLGMLNSCAANVCVVNIDAGFKGGYLAGLIAAQSSK